VVCCLFRIVLVLSPRCCCCCFSSLSLSHALFLCLPSTQRRAPRFVHIEFLFLDSQISSSFLLSQSAPCLVVIGSSRHPVLFASIVCFFPVFFRGSSHLSSFSSHMAHIRLVFRILSFVTHTLIPLVFFASYHLCLLARPPSCSFLCALLISASTATLAALALVLC
jgi:hypothetical protein